MRLDVTSTTDGAVGIVTAAGAIDLSTAPRLREAVGDHLADGCAHLLLDLREVTFIDSTGLGLLVGAGKKASGLGGSVRVVCDNPRVLRLLALTGIDRSVAVHATPDEARAGWPPEE